MAKIIAVYIAHGRRSSGSRMTDLNYPLGQDVLLEWRRIFCLFSIARSLSDDGDMPRFVLLADHKPPIIDGRLLEFHLKRLGVEINEIDHMWRPAESSNPGAFFIFDALEKLVSMTQSEDRVLLLSSRSLVVNAPAPLFSELEKTSALFVEASFGEIGEDHDRAVRDRIMNLRRHFNIACPVTAMHTASSDMLGFTHGRMQSLLADLRPIFSKNILREANGDDHFKSAGELIAAALAQENLTEPSLARLRDYAAAMPNDFAIARLDDIPITIPGYGREPDIMLLYDQLMADRLVDQDRMTKSFVIAAIRNIALAQSQLIRARGWRALFRSA